MKGRKLGWLLSVALVAPAALAQEGPRARGQGWAVLSSQTVGTNATVLGAEAGFPGLSVSLVRGLQDRFDVGGRFSLLYAYASQVNAIYPGLELEVYGKLELLEPGRLGLSLQFGVGFLSAFAFGANPVGVSLPFALVAGIPIGAAIVAHFSLELPVFVTLGTYGGMTVPVLAGVGLEYFIDRSLLLTFKTRMGPVINSTIINAGNTGLGFEALAGVAFKL